MAWCKILGRLKLFALGMKADKEIVMIEQAAFRKLDSYTNNFKKIVHISSELIYSNQRDYEEPQITILVITYRRPALLKDAIKSIVCQQHVDYPWEVVVMDNDPDSVLPEWLPDVSRNLSLRYYINSQNLGHEGNMNRGIQLSKGKWVALLHDDDLLVSNYLQLIPRYVDAAKKWKKPLAYVRANYEEFYGDVEESFFDYTSPKENTRLWRKCLWIGILINGVGPTSINSCGSLVNRSAFMDVGGYNEELNPIGDSTLGIIFMNNDYCVAETAVPLGFYRQGKNESSKKETLYGFLRADYLLREHLYNKNVFSKLFGCCFRNTQFYLQFQDRNERAQRFGYVLTEEELQLPINMKRSVVMEKLLILIRRIFLAVYRPNIILTRWRKYHESRYFSGRIRHKN